MIANETQIEDKQFHILTVKGLILSALEKEGSIVCVDRFALDSGRTPWYVRMCIRELEQKGILHVNKLTHKSGKPIKARLGKNPWKQNSFDCLWVFPEEEKA